MAGVNTQDSLVFSRQRMKMNLAARQQQKSTQWQQSESENHHCQPTTVTALRKTRQWYHSTWKRIETLKTLMRWLHQDQTWRTAEVKKEDEYERICASDFYGNRSSTYTHLVSYGASTWTTQKGIALMGRGKGLVELTTCSDWLSCRFMMQPLLSSVMWCYYSRDYIYGSWPVPSGFEYEVMARLPAGDGRGSRVHSDVLYFL